MSGVKGKSGMHGKQGRKKIGVVKIQTTVEPAVKKEAKENHGTIANAIRFAAKHKPSKEI